MECFFVCDVRKAWLDKGQGIYYELTLEPSFPGAPSGPFCPLSPCWTKMKAAC